MTVIISRPLAKSTAADERVKPMKERYIRNIGILTKEEQHSLMSKSVCVAGCGGLGGNIIEELARMGVGHLRVIDEDIFEESNLNRQILSREGNLGCSKALEALDRVKNINSDVDIEAVEARISKDNCRDLIHGCTVVVDAVDNVETRLLLEAACEEEKVPFVHGAIGSWCGQVAVSMPGDRAIAKIYGEEESGEEKPSSPAFIPAAVAAIQVAETIKLLLNREGVLADRLLMIDLLNNDYEVIDL